MSDAKHFFTPDEEQLIVNAIITAEKNTSGEIRVHIENHSEKPPLERAKEVFYLLNMDKTKARNGVLFYLATTDRTFALLGDEGINTVVEDDFWDCTKDVVIDHFKNNRFAQGLAEGILRAGDRLKQYFPYEEDDVDELPNEISKS
ncbi:TPM domain-containing protein [Flavobacterium sp. NRK1]|jgi:uncharacterized membrane protein|uniref:TPM domain-containing protein n=1 Tax=Flavobacterium sp. NRK1 TaxID=2954929 RepID=UPI002093E2B7|nr:TPM domain-containing protein [Flavobacterium sp. NRK1]MCO6148268.1 TPM domain-containing protein [Flavobacterium sp. NRK1]